MANGYYVYRGIGGSGAVDYDTPVATLAADATSASLVGLGHVAGERYTYVVRPFRGSLVTPDYSCRAEVAMDADGDWLGARPERPGPLSAEIQDGGDVRLSWTYYVPDDRAEPADFAIYYATSPGITPNGSPQATMDWVGRSGVYAKALSLSGGTTYWFRVTARTSGGVESRPSNEVGPILADGTGPTTPALVTGVGF